MITTNTFSEQAQQFMAHNWGWIALGVLVVGTLVRQMSSRNGLKSLKGTSDTVREINLRERIEEIQE